MAIPLFTSIGGSGRYLNSSFILDSMRMIKDEQEIALMREAAGSNDQAMAALVKLLPAMHTEKQLGQLLLGIYEELGTSGFSFSPNISFVTNGADPHHKIDDSRRTGHCIGLDVHDWGDVSSANQEYVRPGMIFSIEPGIYLPGELGVRVEDLVLVTESGCELLTHYDKELTIIE
jgi:Xaa-Pro aminopeptidase